MQRTVANTEQINDIEERIEWLISKVPAFPAGDPDTEEIARRTDLRKLVFALQEALTHLIASVACRKLVRISTELRHLSEQPAIGRFLMNEHHADRLNSLVRDLAYAVADYQVFCAKIILRSGSDASDSHQHNKAFTRIPKRSKKRLRGPTGQQRELARQQGGSKKQRGGWKRQRRRLAARRRESAIRLRVFMISEKDSTRRRRRSTTQQMKSTKISEHLL